MKIAQFDVLREIVVGCRFALAYRAENGKDVVVVCVKHGERQSCKYCQTCPKCGGKMKYSRPGLGSEVEVMDCVNCSLTIQLDIVYSAPVEDDHEEIEPEEDDNLPPVCAVEGCKARTWDARTWHGQRICLTHANQIKTWRRKEQPNAVFPLIRVDNKIKQNPNYRTIDMSK